MRHTQIFIRAEVREPLITQVRADSFMRKAVKAAGMNIIGGPYSVIGDVPGNEGVSSVCILDFSSASLHEWHEAKPYPLIHFDLYTCGNPPVVERFEELFADLGLIEFAAKVVDLDLMLNDMPGWCLAEVA